MNPFHLYPSGPFVSPALGTKCSALHTNHKQTDVFDGIYRAHRNSKRMNLFNFNHHDLSSGAMNHPDAFSFLFLSDRHSSNSSRILSMLFAPSDTLTFWGVNSISLCRGSKQSFWLFSLVFFKNQSDIHCGIINPQQSRILPELNQPQQLITVHGLWAKT